MKDFLKDFSMRHPVATYFTVVGTIGTVCRYTVELVRSITGKYPSAPPISVNVTPKQKEESKKLHFVNPLEDTEEEISNNSDFS